jgi:hypothetical protein
MRHKLAAGIALAILGGAALAQTTTKIAPEHHSVMPEQVKWGPPPPGLPPALEAAVIDGDPTQAAFYVVRLRLPDGAQLKPHWHSRDEHITVISGHFLMGMGESWNPSQMRDLPPGGYSSLPATQKHFAQARGQTIVQVDGMGPFDIHYVTPSDDPRSKRSSR